MEFKAYTDGSYQDTFKVIGAGIVILDAANQIVTTKKAHSIEDTHVALRNVSAEILAAFVAIGYIQETYRHIANKSLTVYHDNEGVGKWPDRQQRARKAVTAAYVAYVDSVRKEFPVRFQWVKGHSGDPFNTLADKLAEEAVKDYIQKMRSEVF